MNPDARGGIAPPTARPGEPVHWLVRPRTVRGLWIGFSLILAALVLGDFLVHGHPGFGIDGTFGFYAWYGLGTCVAMVLFAKALGLILKRPDTYYEGEGGSVSEAEAPGTAARGTTGTPGAAAEGAAVDAAGATAAVVGERKKAQAAQGREPSASIAGRPGEASETAKIAEAKGKGGPDG